MLFRSAQVAAEAEHHALDLEQRGDPRLIELPLGAEDGVVDALESFRDGQNVRVEIVP